MQIETQRQLDDLIATADESNTIVLDESLEIIFDCQIPCNIKAWNIKAWSIKAHNIIAYHNINANDIKAHNIDAINIKARNIEYCVFCIAYESLKCESISGETENSLHKCLEQEIEIIKKEEEKVTIELTKSQLDKIKHLI